MLARPVSFVNACVLAEGGLASSIRFSRRVLALDESPAKGDVVVDLEGAFVLPGLVNAHDHLELNHFGRVKHRTFYENASDWIDDMRPKLRGDPRIREAASHRLSHRLLAGGLKNLLSGATTVCHHNPLYPPLRRRFPVRVVRRFGWAHSFVLEGQPVGARGERGEEVARAYRRTRPDVPFLVHLAEGVDERARRELSRLEELGCLGSNTILVHGVALSCEEWTRARSLGVGLVWCPSSNLFLLGQTAPVRELLQCAPASREGIALGTDSRLTGARDLLEELRDARRISGLSPRDILPMVTTNPARLLRLPGCGRLAPSLPADLLVLPPLAGDPAEALVGASRKDLRLVIVGGKPAIGVPELGVVFTARRVRSSPAVLDGEPRLLARKTAHAIGSSSVSEPGLEIGCAS